MNNLISGYNQFLAQWTDFFLTNSMEILLLAVPAILFSLLFKQKAPKFHYIIWSIVMLKSLIPSSIINFQSPVNYTLVLPAVVTNEMAVSTSSEINDFQNILFLLWTGIVGFLLVKLILNTRYFNNATRSKTGIFTPDLSKIKLQYGINRSVKLYKANIDIPFTIGVVNPKIFLPNHAKVKSDQFILAHELAHIKRNDFLMIGLQNIVTILYFFHPVVLLSAGFLNYYRELICDDMAVATIDSTPQNYSRRLINYLESCIKQKRYPLLANGFIFSKKIMLKRIEFLLNKKNNRELKMNKFQLTLISLMAGLMIYIIACETITKPSNQQHPQSSHITLHSPTPQFAGDSTVVNVAIGKSVAESKFDILQSNGNSEQDNEALARVKNENLLSHLRNKGQTELTITVKFVNAKQPQKKVKFIPYDKAPEPRGGFAAIQKNVVYPPEAQTAGIEGTVVIQAYIDKAGAVQTTEILKGIPNTGLNEAAINAIRAAKYKPAEREGEQVGVWISIPVVFKLNNQQ